ncbi:MAG: hypothetical protein JO043_08275 [Candidatus Eremiobacteraeota bacterium]|nr:hypothetical protein [Candidatus Eremiobacteraeota bacterium]
MALRVLVAVFAVVLVVVFVAYAGTYIVYLIVAMRHPPKSPFTIACTQVAAPSRNAVKVRFEVTSAAAKDATYLNFALFAQGSSRRNLSDWGYALQRRIPARGFASATVAIPLPPDYREVTFSGVRCNLINVAFADGSQQDYTADNTTFP